MNLLLDTHALLWFVAGDRRLGRAARTAMQDDGATLHISAASVWELAIKSARGRLELAVPVDHYLSDRVQEGYVVLPVAWPHAAAVERLPRHHDDPFDRLIVAQAMAEQMPVVSRDRIFGKYGIDVIW